MESEISGYARVVVSFAVRERINERRSEAEGRETGEPMKFSQRLFGHLSEWWHKDHTYTHCEISFLPDKVTATSKCLTYAVFSNNSDEAVVKLPRSFNDLYEHKTLSLTNREMKKMYNFLEKQVGKRFDYWGSMWGTLWSGQFNTDRDNWYCCSLTVAALQSVGLLYGVRPNCIDIDELYEILESVGDDISRMVPSQHQKISEIFNKPQIEKKQLQQPKPARWLVKPQKQSRIKRGNYSISRPTQ